MDCKGLEGLLSQRTLAELTPEQRAAVAAHMEACPACREKWGLDQQSQALHDAAKPLRANGSVREAVMAKLDDAKKPTPPPDAKEQAQEPRRLGGFELLGRLGKGGMGTVLKARQVSMDRLVALKILPRKLAEDERFVQRFLREARSAAKLRHPNIVQAFDVGQTEGYYFFAMEFVDGETLADIVRRDGPLEPSRALDVMKQVASALAAAHKEGIVHRDIKPSNIMLDKEGQVRVTDFGLAKRTEGDVAVTADGAVVGTPAYVAPEMAKGGEADPRSDLYSLGAALFCALAGRPPFEGKNFSEVLIKQATEQAPPLAALAPRVDRRLCHIVDRLLRKNPEARYPSATALLDDLNGLGKLQSVAAAARAEGRAMLAEAPTLEMTEGKRRERAARLEAQRPPRSRTTLIAVGAIAALLAVVGIVLATRKPKGTATSVPDNRKPETGNLTGGTAKTPQDAKKTTVAVVDDAEAKRIAAELAEKERIAKARRQGEDLLKQADAAIAAKDFAKARAIIKAVEALGLPDLDDEAASKLKEIASREKSAAEWAKWDALKADARKLIDAGKLDEAAKLLDGAKALPLEGIADLVAEQVESIEVAKSAMRKAALAAYLKESDQAWALFRERKYPEGQRILSPLAANLPQAADVREVILKHVKADQEATMRLKEFWAAVERGILARKGKFVSIAGKGGNVESIENGQVTLKVGTRELTAPLLGMDAAQAVAIADLKDDERGNLVKAIFLIAEGDKLDRAQLDAAGKLLDTAGNPPGLAYYRDRLDTLTLGAAEVAARNAWAEVEATAAPEPGTAQAQRLLTLLDAFEKTHANTKHFAAVRDKLADLRGQAQPGPKPGAWVGLFDGKTLKGWRVVDAGDFKGHGEVVVAKGCVGLEAGNPATAIACTEKLPTENYELRFEAMRVAGTEDMCSLVFPVGASHCLLGVGGWAWPAGKVALDRVDGVTGDKNITSRPFPIEQGRWYQVQLAVTAKAIQVSVDRVRVIDMAREGHEFAAADFLAPLKPLGFYAWRTKTAVRNIMLRRLSPQPEPRAEAPKPGEWVSLFDGKTLSGWKLIELNVFRDHGKVHPEDGCLILEKGREATGIQWTGQFPKVDYEVALEAKCPPEGFNFFYLTFPVASSSCTLVMLAKEPGQLALQWVDGKKAWENATARTVELQRERWHAVQLRVTGARVEVWVNGSKMIDFPTAGHTLEAQGAWEHLRPFGLAAWQSASAFRNIRVRRIEPGAVEAPKAGEWQGLFDGKSLDGWAVVEDFPGRGAGGPVRVEDGCLALKSGAEFAGIVLKRPFPDAGYEIELEAQRVAGNGDLVGITFPIGTERCSFVVGGAENRLTGLQVIDGQPLGFSPDAVSRQTCENGRWYSVRLRVTAARIEAWVDDKEVVDFATAGRRLSVYPTWRDIKPLGLTTSKGAGRLRNIRYRRVAPAEPGGWRSLFDGKTLDGWRVPGDFPGMGKGGTVRVEGGSAILETDARLTGLGFDGDFPTESYEVEIELSLLQGGGEFFYVTFPVASQLCVLHAGYHGRLFGLELIDGKRVNTSGVGRDCRFVLNRWYTIRIRVTPERIEAWEGANKLIDFAREGHKLSARAEFGAVRPFGITTRDHRLAVRAVRLLRLGAERAGKWQSLFDGKTLEGWKGPKELHVEDGQLVMEIGNYARGGFSWTGEFPKTDYELELELVKTEGTNVCGLILPVGELPAALGIADHDIGLGSANKKMPFPRGKWFRLRVRVTQPKVQVWVDDALVIDLPTEGQQFGIWSGHQGLRPFGIHTRTTRVALRNIRLRRLGPEGAPRAGAP